MKQVIDFQSMDMMAQMLLGGELQMAEYGPLDWGKALQQLGRTHFCTAEALPNLLPQSVHAFQEHHLLNKPEGIVVLGSGIHNDALVELTKSNFGHIAGPGTTNNNDASSNNRAIPFIYIGGEYRLQNPPNPNPAKEEFTHVVIAFEVGGWYSLDLVSMCVLQISNIS